MTTRQYTTAAIVAATLAALLAISLLLTAASSHERFEDGSGRLHYGLVTVIYCLPWEICNEK